MTLAAPFAAVASTLICWTTADLRPSCAVRGCEPRVDSALLAASHGMSGMPHLFAWFQHPIEFEREPLGEVADEFNRHGEITLEIGDADLRALPVSGIFNAYDTDSLAGFLATLDGVVVERTPKRILVLRLNARMDEPFITAR